MLFCVANRKRLEIDNMWYHICEDVTKDDYYDLDPYALSRLYINRLLYQKYGPWKTAIATRNYHKVYASFDQ